MTRGLVVASRAHLAGVGESYGEHMRFALAAGSLLILAGLACLIHAVLPALFPDRASRTIRRLHAAIEDRAGPESLRLSESEADGLLTLAGLALLAAALPWLAGFPAPVAAAVSLIALALPLAALHAADEGDALA